MAKKVSGDLRGSGRSVVVEVNGLQQLATLFASVANTDLPKNLQAVHTRKLQDINNYAEAYFEAEVTRPNESGERGHARVTGNFTFGGAGATFRGRIIKEGNSYGFGYPIIARADQRTNFVWRSLEWGLSPNPGAIKNEFSPRGRAMFPAKFTFLPFSKQQGVFYPAAKGKARPSGKLVTPRGQVLRTVAAPGIPARLFITRAFQRVAETMDAAYRQVTATTFAKFK